MSLKLTTAPAEEPITRANAKIKLGIASGDTASDSQLDWMIPAARRWVEQRTGRALITQTWQLYLDEFPRAISLPLGHVQSVTHIKYTDSDGTVITMSAADYQTDLVSEPARAAPSYAAGIWPVARTNTLNAVEVQFVAGYGLTATIPEDIIEALYRIVGHWINEQASVETTSYSVISRVPYGVQEMLWPYIIYNYGVA